MKVKADLHLHSCLSPCGDNDMTPYNIVNMAKLLGYDMIALTDHNSCLNCEGAVEAGKKAGITVVPGMELCTAEEIHCICLFPETNAALEFSDYIRSTMPDIKNRPDIYGEQIIMGSQDEITGREDRLLHLASSVSVDSLVSLVSGYDGVCFPAHLDRNSYSLLSVIGFVYPELCFRAAEFTPDADVAPFLEKHPLLKEMKILKNSDAHYLENMLPPVQTLELRECSAKALTEFLNS
ncbi:MAG: PHP domain-containing protein [Ruminococcaceae bacterium]|nr:PHP domain-containing protein [Oscillospiraceae bacterium]